MPRLSTVVLKVSVSALLCAGNLPAREEGEPFWAVSFPGPVEGSDAYGIEARDIAADASGTVFVAGTGTCPNRGDDPYTEGHPSVAAFDAEGSLLWYAVDRGPWGGTQAICLDPDGSVYAAGYDPEGPGIAITKIDGSGRELWSIRDDAPDVLALVEVRASPDGGLFVLTEANRRSDSVYSRAARYDAEGRRVWEARSSDIPGGEGARPVDIAIDDAGCAHVLSDGSSSEGGTGPVITKYSPAGEAMWVACYGEEQGELGPPVGMALSPDGAVYLLVSAGYEGQDPAVTSKFDSDGKRLWTRSFDPIIAPMGIVADGSGVRVMGVASTSTGHWSGDILTVKYDGDGDLRWTQREEGDVYSEYPARMGIDSAGHIYVSWIADGPRGRDTNTVKYDAAGNRCWRARYEGPGTYNDFLTAMAVGPGGHVVVHCGVTISTAPRVGHATVVYDEQGAEAWSRVARDSTDVDEEPVGLAVDAAGSIYVAGVSSGLETGDDYVTVKLGPEGEALWRRRFTLPGHHREWPCGVGVDAEGNVYVAGTTQSASPSYLHHFLTVKYDGEGNLLWSVLHEDPEIREETATAMALDSAGNIYIAGEANSEAGRVLTVKYDSGGSRLWKALFRCPEPAPGYARPEGIAVGADGSAYLLVYGTAIGTCYTAKYAPEGRELWIHGYGNPDRPREEPQAMCLDGRGNVCIAATTYLPSGEGSGLGSRDMLVYVLGPDGRLLWEATYAGPGRHVDEPTAIAADAEGHVYVTGTTGEVRGTRAVITLKFDARGRRLWEARYVRGEDASCYPASLVVNGAGETYVPVVVAERRGATDPVLKYDRMGRLVWEAEVPDAYLFHYPHRAQLALHPSGDVIATFGTRHPGPCFDWPRITVARIRASTLPPATFVRGEVTGDGQIDLADPIRILAFLFGPEEDPGKAQSCRDAVDANDDGRLDLGDAIALLNQLFAGGPEPQAPYPECGLDPTEDGGAAGLDLGCESYPPCE